MADESAAWDGVAPTYGQSTELLTSQYIPALLEAAEVASGSRLADVACGTGAATVAAVAIGATVGALDFSRPMLDELEARAAADGLTGIETAHGDAQSLPWADAAFTAAVSNFGVIFCPDVDLALREMRRVVAPGGRVAISAWTSAAENIWTALLPDDIAERLGFELPTPYLYRWRDAVGLGTSLEAAGLSEVVIERRSAIGPTVADAALVRSFVEGPVTRSSLSELSDEQILRLGEVVEGIVAEQIAEAGQVQLPANAWVASGVVG